MDARALRVITIDAGILATALFFAWWWLVGEAPVFWSGAHAYGLALLILGSYYTAK